jgi:hypothetical protein
MKKRTEIIKEQEDEILIRLKEIKAMQTEVNTMQKFVDSLRVLGEENILVTAKSGIQLESPMANFPDYPLAGSLLDKLRYLEDRTLKVWMRKDMDRLIEQIEGKEMSTKTLKNSSQKIHYYIHKQEMLNLKYNNSNKYSFYSCRREWTEQVDGLTRLLPQHEPEESKIASLTLEQRKPENITWNGIN